VFCIARFTYAFADGSFHSVLLFVLLTAEFVWLSCTERPVDVQTRSDDALGARRVALLCKRQCRCCFPCSGTEAQA